jgi:hypothetical protein
MCREFDLLPAEDRQTVSVVIFSSLWAALVPPRETTSMAIERWNPSQATTPREQRLLSRTKRHRKLISFLREFRHELFDASFQDELAAMYRDTGAGAEPVVPALMAMAVLLQGYEHVSDAEAVERTIIDLRWQMVLDRVGSEEPAFSQGAFQEFRQRMARCDMDRRLLERTVELARLTGGFDFRKLPKSLRVAVDSMPLEGAGRVEDTINLLAHAGRKVVDCAAGLLDWSAERVCREAGTPLLSAPSVKAALDKKWGHEDDRHDAATQLVDELTKLERWLEKHLTDEVKRPPLKDHLATVHQIVAQDLEPDPGGKGGSRVAKGVAPDRRVSVEDKDMRHGRKSKSRRFNGYKRHVARDLDSGLIFACALAAANRPEEDAAADIEADLRYLARPVGELYIDRAYINAPFVGHVEQAGGEIICRPWTTRNGALFPKSRFGINIRDRTITCPAGQTERFQFASTVEFDAELCDRCPLRADCTDASPGHGRTVSIANNEALQKRLRKLAATPAGRARLRERVPVEHTLAHAGRRQGRRARYLGVRKNLWDWRRASAITNLETIHRSLTTTKSRRAA